MCEMLCKRKTDKIAIKWQANEKIASTAAAKKQEMVYKNQFIVKMGKIHLDAEQ